MMFKKSIFTGFVYLMSLAAAYAEAPGDPKAVKSTDGKYYDINGDPTYNIGGDGAVD
jgi:hypothetical protein